MVSDLLPKSVPFHGSFRKTVLLFISCIIFHCAVAQVTITGSISVCAGETASYSVASVPSGTYIWTASDGNVSGSSNIVSITWDTAGTGVVLVQVINGNNQVSIGSLNVTVHPKPVPHITWPAYPTCPADSARNPNGSQGHDVPCFSVCKNSTVQYSTPLHPLSTYLWVVNGATSFTGQGTNSIVVNWDATASGQVVAVETNSFGCADSSTLCITKADIPVAQFTSQSNVCLNTLTAFTNNSTGATSYQWFFGDGGISNADNPSHAYAAAGTYTITLVAMNDCHCTDTFRRTITVDAEPGPDIECPSTVCAGDTQTYHTNAPGCVYHWSVTGGAIISPLGAPSITVVWGPGMIGHIYLWVTGCGAFCSDTTIATVPIIPSVATISGPVKVCPGDCSTYSLPHFSGAVFTWSLSGSAGGYITHQDCNEVEVCFPVNQFFGNDTLNVSYFDTFLNCGGTGKLIIFLRPQLSLTAASPACANGTSTVNAFGGINCNWSLSPAGPGFTGNGTSSITIAWAGNTGNYSVTATPVVPTQTCNDTARVQIHVIQPPSKPVITGDTIICPGNVYGYCAVGTNIHWMITGGTPTSGTGNCISVTWNLTGPYSVQAFQQMTSSPGCSSDTASQAVYSALPAAPPVLTGPNVDCANDTSAFGTTTLYPLSATYNWSINPANAGSVITGQGTNAAIIQWGNNAPSSVTVTLTVNLCSQSLSSSKVVALKPAPTPTIVVNGMFCPGVNVTLSATGGTYTAYQWSGPGAFTSVSNPSSLISLPGYYHVTVTDINGCTGSGVKQVTQLPGPLASISTANPLSYCIGTSFVVTLNALTNPGYTYLWSNAATGNPINVTSAGTYSVTVTDQNGCTSLSNFITIATVNCPVVQPCTPNGSVSFIHPAFYGCNPVTFTNTSVNATSFLWDFGNGFGSPNANPVYTYPLAGFYLVTLNGYVPNAAGTDSCLLQDTAHIEIPLAPRFSSIAGCAADSVCFTDISTHTPGNNITTWNWNFGDATTSPLQNPCHKYAVGGTYYVTLTIGNGTCTSSWLDSVIVLPQPAAAFNFSNPSCTNTNILFTDASTPAGINYWSWTFGDAGTSLNQNPNHSYAFAGNYNVQLLVSNAFGCKDSITHIDTIVSPNITGSITAYPDTVVCANTNVLLVAPACAGCTYQWSNGGTNDSITVTTTGIYLLTVTDVNGCSKVMFIHITVTPGPNTVITNNGADKFCLGGYTYLSAFYSVNYLYSWITNDIPNNGNTNSGISVFPATYGVYQYQVAITDTATGCSDTSLAYIITVTDTPARPVITALGPTTVCDGDTIKLVVTFADTTLSVKWNNGEISDTISVTATGCYSATVVDSNGCSNFATMCVTVNPGPELCAFYEGCLDTCRPYIIRGPAGLTSYQWLFNGAPISGATSQNYTATVNGNYSLIGSNSFGCIDTTGLLQLTLHDCSDSSCAKLVVDTIFCDGQGNYIFHYHLINHSGHLINQTNLLVLAPNLNTLYGPVTSIDTVLSGDTSVVHSATIYGMPAGSHLCFVTHVQELNEEGEEQFCCNSDTVCFVLPPCDTNCCYLHVISDSVWCLGTDSAGHNKYGFNALLNGCGKLQLTTPDGNITGTTNYNLTGGNLSVNGIFTDVPPVTGTFCLGFIVMHGAAVCFDTTVCMPLPHCDSSCCYLHVISDTVSCKGIDTAGNHIYYFKVRINGCGNLVLQTNDGTITTPTSFTLSPGVTTISGAFVDNPPVNGFFCLNFLLFKSGAVCADTSVCFDLPHCDTLPVLPECYLKFSDSICQGHSTSFAYTGSTTGHTFQWIFTGGSPATGTGPGPITVTYNTVGCFPVQLNITTGNHVSVCYDTICVLAPPVASITQTGSTLYAYPAGYNYQWYTGPPNWAPVAGAVNQFFAPGGPPAVYCVVVSNNYGCSDTACRDYESTGIDEPGLGFTWSIVPNPNNGTFQMMIVNPAIGTMSYNITNAIGDQVLSGEFESTGNEMKKVQISHSFASGIYFIKLESEKRWSVQRVIVR